jgi:hypothetical protein
MLPVAFEAQIPALFAAAPFTTRAERERGRPSVLPQLRDPKPRYRPDLQQVQLSTQGGRRAEVQGHDDDEPASSAPASCTRAAGRPGSACASRAARGHSRSSIGRRRGGAVAGVEDEGHDGGRRVPSAWHARGPSVASCGIAGDLGTRRPAGTRGLRRPSSGPAAVRPSAGGEPPSTGSFWRARGAQPPLRCRRAAAGSRRVRNRWRSVSLRSDGDRRERPSGRDGRGRELRRWRGELWGWFWRFTASRRFRGGWVSTGGGVAAVA